MGGVLPAAMAKTPICPKMLMSFGGLRLIDADDGWVHIAAADSERFEVVGLLMAEPREVAGADEVDSKKRPDQGVGRDDIEQPEFFDRLVRNRHV
jgi:hypothetical protein